MSTLSFFSAQSIPHARASGAGPSCSRLECGALDDEPQKLSADQAYELAAKRHGVTVKEMQSRSRLRHLHAARVDAWRILRAQGWSLTGIGAAVGRDHTSICVALKERG